MSTHPFDDRLRRELHDLVANEAPTPALRERAERKASTATSRRLIALPRPTMLAAGAIAAAILAVVALVAVIDTDSDDETNLATRPPQTASAPVPSSPESSVGASTTNSVRTSTTKGPQTTVTRQGPAVAPTTTTTSRPEPCAPTISVATDRSTYQRGTPVSITATLTNPSSSPCNPPCMGDDQIDFGTDNVAGSGAWYDVAGCPPTLAGRGSWSVTRVWCQEERGEVHSSGDPTSDQRPCDQRLSTSSQVPSGRYYVVTMFVSPNDPEQPTADDTYITIE